MVGLGDNGLEPTARQHAGFGEQTQPIQSLFGFGPRDVHSPREVRLGLSTLSFFNIRADTGSGARELPRDDHTANVTRQGAHEPKNPNGKREAARGYVDLSAIPGRTRTVSPFASIHNS